MRTIHSTQETNESIITGRRNRVLLRQGYVALLGRILFFLVALWLLLTRVFLMTQASGSDMFPAVKDGDLVIGFRLQGEYVKNDVVVYTAQGTAHIGRIAARAGDVVTLDDSGTLLVNGTAQSGEILYPTYPGEALTYPYSVPQGQVFILGDYRTQAQDSRSFGPVPLTQIQAKVITILRRRGL